MTLRYYRYEYRVTAVAVTLVECPFCGHPFEANEPRWRHFLEEHDADDVPGPRVDVDAGENSA